MLTQKLIRFTFLKHLSNNLVPHYLWNIKVLNRNPFAEPYVSLADLDVQKPDCFHDAYELSDAVMIRSYAS